LVVVIGAVEVEEFTPKILFLRSVFGFNSFLLELSASSVFTLPYPSTIIAVFFLISALTYAGTQCCQEMNIIFEIYFCLSRIEW
jgi:hypothetical protein